MRKHGPLGYRNYQAFKPWLRDEFAFRCVYCLLRETWEQAGSDGFGIDHHVPQSQAPERVCDYENLLYVCTGCNSMKRDSLDVLDPCHHALGYHLAIRDDGTIEGLTSIGRQFIQRLRLDRPRITKFRHRMMVIIRALAADTSAEAIDALRELLGFPRDLPDLHRLRPPGGNSRPDGVQSCWFSLREQGLLPGSY